MLAKAVLLVLVITNAVHAQTSTASLFPVGFGGDQLEGQAVGTGSEGTTYVLSGTFASPAIPFTVTLVQDSTHISEGAVLETGGVSIIVDAECGISGSQAVCTQVLVEPALTTTNIQSGSVSFTAVPVRTGSGSASGTGTGTGSASGVSTLAPSISVTSPASASTGASTSRSQVTISSITAASLTSASASASDSASSSSATTSRMAFDVWGLVAVHFVALAFGLTCF